MKIKEVIAILESFAPLSLQESYDNAGLITGSPDDEAMAALISLDVTEEIIDEAINKKANLIIAHHPVIFSGLKKLTGATYVERVVIKAIRNNIAIYATHTNADAVHEGVSFKIGHKLGLQDIKVLTPEKNALLKLVTFVPTSYAQAVRDAIFKAGAGVIGNYDSCSFNVNGSGTFRGNESTSPFVGTKGVLHNEEEIRLETIIPRHIKGRVIKALLLTHPYEEVAYDLYPLENASPMSGMGSIGHLSVPIRTSDFMALLKKTFQCACIRHTKLIKETIEKVAICGGSGSSLLPDAIKAGADIFISADFKYHQFFDADGHIIIADIGHYESEQFTKELFYDLLIKNFPTFALYFSEINTNPINYF